MFAHFRRFTRRIFNVLTLVLHGILSLFLRSRSTSRIYGNLAAFCCFVVFDRLPSCYREILIFCVISISNSLPFCCDTGFAFLARSI